MERYRITDDAGIYYVTMSVVDWLPVFVSDGACRILADSLNFFGFLLALRGKGEECGDSESARVVSSEMCRLVESIEPARAVPTGKISDVETFGHAFRRGRRPSPNSNMPPRKCRPPIGDLRSCVSAGSETSRNSVPNERNRSGVFLPRLVDRNRGQSERAFDFLGGDRRRPKARR